jgi:hypothetical protein
MVLRLLVLLVLCAGVASAQRGVSIGFDDAGFNYYAQRQGVVQLEYSGGALTLKLVKTANPHGVTHRFAVIPRLSEAAHDRLYGTYDPHAHGLTEHDQAALRATERERLAGLAGISRIHGGVSVTHQRAFLDATLDYYLGALADAGFAATPEVQATNVRVFRLENGAQAAKVSFVRAGSTVQVHLTGAR